MLGTYVMYLGRDNDDDFHGQESNDKDFYSNLQILLCRHYEIRKDSQKYGQCSCINC